MDSLRFALSSMLTLILPPCCCNAWRFCWVFCAGSHRAFSARSLARRPRDRPSPARSFRTRSRGVVDVIWTLAWPSSPGRLPGALGAANPIVVGDRDVVFDVDSTLISIMTEAVGVATCCCPSGPGRCPAMSSALILCFFSNICFQEEWITLLLIKMISLQK